MRTPEMSDEELDALFRRGAETYPDEVHLGAWARMEDKLNEAALHQLLRQKIAKWFAVELVLVGLALVVWQISWRHRSAAELSGKAKQTTAAIAEKPKSTPASRQSAVLVVPEPRSAASTLSVAPAGTAALPSAAATQSTESNTATTSLAIPQAATLLPPKNQPTSAARLKLTGVLMPNRRRAAVGKEASLTKSSYSSPATPAAAPSTSGSQGDDPSSTESSSAAELPTPQTAAVSTESAAPTATTSTAVPNVAPTSAQDTTAKKPTIPAEAADSTKTKAHVKPAYRLLIGALGAPSLSAVRSVQTARMGGDLGLSLEYRLTNRLRVRASVIRSVKRYKVESEYYTPPAEWGWRPGNYEVNGNCRITEIPIDLRYDLISRPSYTVFFSAGMNSLMMRNERYNYDYYVNGQARTAAACVENGANFVLSVVNLSTGAERQLNNHLSLQAEPFVQLPLGGVGAAKVRLSSAGLLFSLKYGFLPSHRAVAP